MPEKRHPIAQRSQTRSRIDELDPHVDADPLIHCTHGIANMTARRTLRLTVALIVVGFILILLLNSRFGVDRDETFTDLHRPEIVGESQSNAP